MSPNRRDFIKGSVAATALAGLASVEQSCSGAEMPRGEVLFDRRIPIRHDVDVFMAGGGPSGVAAAVSAARQGARVFLAERNNCLGGMGTAGMLPLFMPFTDVIDIVDHGGAELRISWHSNPARFHAFAGHTGLHFRLHGGTTRSR
jgi:hypothetical protein